MFVVGSTGDRLRNGDARKPKEIKVLLHIDLGGPV